jgi:predicted metal-dependent phosphoesterase TrpH
VGLQGLSITDHDTIDAYTPQLFAEAETAGLRLLSGIEVSSEQDDVSIHVLGYGYDLNDKKFKEFLIQMQMRRAERNRAILQKLAQQKMPISEEELRAFATHRTVCSNDSRRF